MVADVITSKAKITAPKEHAGLPPPLVCLCDVTVLCICASVGMLKTTQKGTFTKASETAMKRFLHASHDMSVEDAVLARRLLFDYAFVHRLLMIDNDAYRPIPHNIL